MSVPAAIVTLVVCAIVIGYLLGSIMTSDIVARIVSRSARDYCSKNPGTTNSFRVYGKKWGIVVGVFDILKSFLSFVVVWLILQYGLKDYLNDQTYNKVYYLAYLANLFAIIGHCWPVYFRFKGGKAAAPAVGMMLSMSIIGILLMVLVWTTILIKTRYVSLASIVTSFLLPLIALVPYINFLHFFYTLPDPFMIGATPALPAYNQDWYVYIFLFLNNLCVCAIVVWRHLPNLKRLLAGTENKMRAAA